MRAYQVTAFTGITLPAGTVLRLSVAQAALRAQLLEKQRASDTYVATAPVQFKRGEKFETADDMPKQAILEDLTEIDERDAKAAREQAAREQREAEQELARKRAAAEQHAALVAEAKALGATDAQLAGLDAAAVAAELERLKAAK